MRRFFLVLSLAVLGMCLFSTSAMALSFDDITARYDDTGLESVFLIDTDGVDDDATAFLLFEFGDYAPGNKFGIYDYSVDGSGNVVLGDMLELFSGVAAPLISETIAFDLAAGTATATSTGVSANIDATFGFYITNAPGNTFYSHTALNTVDGIDHMMLFDTRDHVLPGLLGSNVVIAIEDLLYGGDLDYNDMVVGISDVAPVPEPSTVLLLGAGIIGVVAIARKRLNK
jgi:hypothetical protein